MIYKLSGGVPLKYKITLSGNFQIFDAPGSGLFLTPPNTVVSGNAGFGLQCTDGESSVVNIGLLNLSGGNGLGGVSGSCTGF